MKKSLVVLAGVVLMALTVPMTAKASSPSVNNLPQAPTQQVETQVSEPAQAAEVTQAAPVAEVNLLAANVDDEPVPMELIAANVDDDMIFIAPNTGESNMIYLVYGIASLAIIGLTVVGVKVTK